MKKISILGSTGSIGVQTLEIAAASQDLKVVGLTTNVNIDLLHEQILEFKPRVVAVMNEEKAQQLKDRVGAQVEVLSGMEGLIAVATMEEAEVVVTAVVGMIGLQPTIKAIEAGKDIALANKETLVTAGELIMPLVKEKKVRLLPVDSEHSAIFQALQGEDYARIDKIWLTASGGPFRNKKQADLEHVTLAQALKHPNWSMGHKITVDSATMMNKGLEVIEAKWLFGVEPEQIQVLVHPQSIIHSMVEFKDSSVIAQMGLPDMKLPIQYALYYPNRETNTMKRLNLAAIGKLTFEEPDKKTFSCLQLAYDAMSIGGTMPTVMNAANEWAVKKFIDGEIGFLDIPKIIESAMKQHQVIPSVTLQAILDSEQWTYDLLESGW